MLQLINCQAVSLIPGPGLKVGHSPPNASPPMSVDPVVVIKDPRHHEATGAVLDAFMGPPPQKDPNHSRLWEAGLTLARNVFHHKGY